MSTLAWIIAVSLLGGVLSLLCAAVLAFNARVSWLSVLVSYAIGALLGAAFLNTLPEAFELAENPIHVTMMVLIGILFFFILEKLVLWRHCHLEDCEAHDLLHGKETTVSQHSHDYGRSGMMVIVGDTFHNFVDGILIAAAFMVDVQLGIVTSIAIIAHEIPQEAGDFIILLNSGYTRRQAFVKSVFDVCNSGRGSIGVFYVAQYELLSTTATSVCFSEYDLCGNVRLDSWFTPASGN